MGFNYFQLQLKTIQFGFFMFFLFWLGYMNLIQSRGSLNKYFLQYRWKSPGIFDRIDLLKIPIFFKFDDNCLIQIISLLPVLSGELNQKWFRRLRECQIAHILGSFGILKAYILVIDSEALYESESNLRNRKRFEFVSESNPESEAQTFWDRKRNRYRKIFITNIGIGTDTGIGSEVDDCFPF